jgi:hypothetical protein
MYMDGKQVYVENFFKMYELVVTWFSNQLLLVLSILNNWHTHQVDFVLAYTQADIEFDMYMELHMGIKKNTAMEKPMCSNFSKTSLVKNRLDEYGTNILSRD